MREAGIVAEVGTVEFAIGGLGWILGRATQSTLARRGPRGCLKVKLLNIRIQRMRL